MKHYENDSLEIHRIQALFSKLFSICGTKNVSIWNLSAFYNKFYIKWSELMGLI